MENASDALRIAGGVLLALLVVSLIVFGMIRLRKYQNTVDDTKKNEQVTKFNQSFESYNKKVVTGYQMVSLANLVKDMNNKYGQNKSQDYTPVKVWIRLQKEDGGLPGASSAGGVNFINDNGKKYYDLEDYITKVYTQINVDTGTAKQFKNLYFECEGTTYDSREYPKLCEMRFREIKQR